MAKFTEKDIIAYLNDKISFHQKEAKRIESVLSAFTITSKQPKTGKVKAVASSEAIAPLAELVRKKKKIKAVKVSETKPAQPLIIPDNYSDSLQLVEKIAFALKEIGAGFKEDIAKVIAQNKPLSDEIKISKQISSVLSLLKAKGQLISIRIGRKDQYSLPE